MKQEKKRYSFYKTILKKYNSKYLFLAHHGDDLIETILMKISRGSDLEGYAGIKEITFQNDYYIIRPFLKYTKEDLITYNKKNNIKYYIDKSNQNCIYTRNRYRKNILPFLKKEDKNIHKKYLKYSKTLLEYLDYINYETNMLSKNIIKNNTINIKELAKQHPFIQKNILYRILKNYYQNEPNIIKEKHITSIQTIINNPKPNLTINLPKNTVIIKTYNQLIINKDNYQKKKNYKKLLKENITIENITIKKIKETKENGNDICKINSKNIKLPLYIRNRKEGDTIKLRNINGRKKIKEIFIEKKIPLNQRDNYPILVDSNDEIIWIPFLKKSKYTSQKDEIYDIILNSCKKEEKNEQ